MRRWLRPPRQLHPTRAGWAFFALTFGIGFASLNTGNNLLYMVFSLLLSFLVLSGVLSESALRGIQVQRHLPPELYAERTATIVLEVCNDQRRATAYAIAIEDRQGPDVDRARPTGRAFALRIAPGASVERAYRFTPHQRGVLTLAGFRVSTRFPFGLFSKSMLIEAPSEALVFPALDAVRRYLPPQDSPQHAPALRGSAGQSPESATLREWSPGDPQRRIHWRTSLRKGALLCRAGEPDDGGLHAVSLATAGSRPGDTFENAVRRAASEVVGYLDAGYRVELRTETLQLLSDPGRAGRRRLLTFLATVAPAAHGYGETVT